MKKRITFTLPAEAVEGASEVILLGDFNNWNPEVAPRLKKQDASFITIVELEVGNTYHYRFMSNDGRWINDYNAQRYEPAPGLHVDNCVITVTEDIEEPEAPAKSAAKKAASAKPKAEAKTSVAASAEPAVAKPAAKKAPVKAEAPKSAKAKPAAAKPVAKKAGPKAKK